MNPTRSLLPDADSVFGANEAENKDITATVQTYRRKWIQSIPGCFFLPVAMRISSEAVFYSKEFQA